MVDFLVIKCYHDITIVKKDGETMKLWGGRFTKETNQLVAESLHALRKLYENLGENVEMVDNLYLVIRNPEESVMKLATKEANS